MQAFLFKQKLLICTASFLRMLNLLNDDRVNHFNYEEQILEMRDGESWVLSVLFGWSEEYQRWGLVLIQFRYFVEPTCLQFKFSWSFFCTFKFLYFHINRMVPTVIQSKTSRIFYCNTYYMHLQWDCELTVKKGLIAVLEIKDF